MILLLSARQEMYQKQRLDTSPYVQPWASVIQQTLNHQEVPEYFQTDDAMKQTVEILDDEEVLEAATCTPKDIYQDIQDWTTALEVVLD